MVSTLAQELPSWPSNIKPRAYVSAACGTTKKVKTKSVGEKEGKVCSERPGLHSEYKALVGVHFPACLFWRMLTED